MTPLTPSAEAIAAACKRAGVTGELGLSRVRAALEAAYAADAGLAALVVEQERLIRGHDEYNRVNQLLVAENKRLNDDLATSETEAKQNWQLYWDLREAANELLEHLSLRTAIDMQGDVWDRFRHTLAATAPQEEADQ